MGKKTTTAFLKPLELFRRRDLRHAEWQEFQDHLDAKRSPVLVAARRGCAKQLKLLLDAGQPPTQLDNEGITALIETAQMPTQRHFICLHRLLEAGVPLRTKAIVPDYHNVTSPSGSSGRNSRSSSPLNAQHTETQTYREASATLHSVSPLREATDGRHGEPMNEPTDALGVAQSYRNAMYLVLRTHIQRVLRFRFLQRERSDYRQQM